MMNIAYTMSLANMLAATQNLYGWQHSFQILSIFFVQHLCWLLASQLGVSAHEAHI